MVLHSIKRRNFSIFYPLEMPLRYTMENQTAGRGRTVELNGEVIRFECDRTLPRGRNIQLVLRWPATLRDGARLNLWVGGVTTSLLCRDIEVEVLRYEFRTRRAAQSPLAPDLRTLLPDNAPDRLHSRIELC